MHVLTRIKLLLTSVIIMIAGILFFSPLAVFALAAQDQACTAAVVYSPFYYRADQHHLAQLFTPSKSKLDAVKLYIYANNNDPTVVDLSIWDANTPSGTLVGTVRKTLTMTPSWVLFDFPTDLTLQKNLRYMISVDQIQGAALWNWVEEGYYSGYMQVDTTQYSGKNFGFITYGYDPSSGSTDPAGSDDSTGTSGTGTPDGSTSSDQSSGTAGTGSNTGTGVSGSSDLTPDINAILEDYKNSGGSQGIFPMLGFIAMRILPGLIIFGLIFILFIIGIIVLVSKRKKKKAVVQVAAPTPAPAVATAPAPAPVATATPPSEPKKEEARTEKK